MSTATQTLLEQEAERGHLTLSETSQQPPHHVEAVIHYVKMAEDGTEPTITDINTDNGRFMDSRKVQIRDVRPSVTDFKLEKHGFEYVKYDVPGDHVSDENAITSVYYPEMEELVKKLTNARMVIVFGHYVRYTPWKEETIHDTGYKGPAKRPHVDVTKDFAFDVLKGQLEKHNKSDEIESALAGRWGLLNIWKPLKVVQKNPLAVTDGATFPTEDLFDLKYELSFAGGGGSKKVETAFGKAPSANAHDWYYLYEQQPNEVLVFKTADSDEQTAARAVTHSSFVAPGTEDMPTRESIELRCLVVY